MGRGARGRRQTIRHSREGGSPSLGKRAGENLELDSRLRGNDGEVAVRLTPSPAANAAPSLFRKRRGEILPTPVSPIRLRPHSHV